MPPLLPNAVVSSLTPSCNALCYCSIHSRTTMASEYPTGGTVNGGGCPPPVLPLCPGYADARSAPLWRSASPLRHYNPQLGSASTLPSLEIHPASPGLVAPPPHPSPSCTKTSFTMPSWVWQYAASDLLSKSFLHSGQLTHSLYISL